LTFSVRAGIHSDRPDSNSSTLKDEDQ